MWLKRYRDYKPDASLVKHPVEPGKGICGCEMHEINGWGLSLDQPKKAERGFLGSLLVYLFRSRRKAK